MKEIPKVSVIVPVYNTGEYVEIAINSIIGQTLRDIEILVINDGSTDKSPEIINKLSLQDNRIKVFSQDNQGLSCSRNAGILQAEGEYLYFMDSDDYLEPDALERCYDKCQNYDLDFVFFDAAILNPDTARDLGLSYQRNKYTDENRIYTGLEVLNILLDNKAYSPSACLNFIRTDFVKTKTMMFYPGIIHEDQLFTGLLYLQAEKVMCIHENFFRRRIRENSIMTNRFSLRNMDSYFIVADELLKYVEKHPQTKETMDKYLSGMLNAAVWLSYKMPFKDRLHIAQYCLSRYREYVTGKNLLILLFKSFVKK